MRRIPTAVSIALLLASTPGFAAPERANCRAPYQQSLDLEPVGTGPLTLTAVYCQVMRNTGLPASAPVVSPDARSIAYYEHDTILRAARLSGANVWEDFPAELGTFARFGSESRSVPAFAWDSTSRFLWTATHDAVRPSGFALSPMRPARTGENGKLDLPPPLEHAAGPLDALLWAGGEGLAVAQFGTRGGFYRPEHDDPDPTFAIVDAARGRLLDTLPFEAIETLRASVRGRRSPYVLVDNAAAAVLPDGRVRALLRVRQWVVWTQGEPPRALPDPYAGEWYGRMVLSPNGEHVLVGRLLRTVGGMCIERVEPRGCSPGTPVEGVLAALHDVATGRALWTIRATVAADYEFPTPAISPDGRYALVGLVPDKRPPLVALVAMASGEIVQRVPAPGGASAFGFANGGRTVWTHAYGVTALYEVATAGR